MFLYLVHHGEAVDSQIDPRRPLSDQGRAVAERLAADTAARGVRPAAVWHSGKLRAKQTAEAFWRACNPLAEFTATRDLQADDPPEWIRDRVRGEARDILIAGHFMHLPKLLGLLVGREDFPKHGVVALASDDDGKTWREVFRLGDG